MKTKVIVLLAIITMLVPSVQGQDVVSDLLSRINNLRASLGVQGYSLNGALSAAAQNQASWMASTGQISHTQPDGSTPSVRAARAGYGSTWVSENIYIGTRATAVTAWNWWLNSPIHYRGITSANYTEVGIGSASGERGTAFVLVFGNPGGSSSVNIRSSVRSSGGEQAVGAVPGLPPYVVGVDNYGHIMHEIQPGHTLGDIALIYGYTWDDLPRIRELNHLSENDHYNLEIGAVLLIPPWDGTYTPTPGGPGPDATSGLVVEDQGIIATVDPNEGNSVPILAAYTVMPASPTLTATVEPTTIPAPTDSSWMAMTVTPVAVAAAPDPDYLMGEPAVVIEEDSDDPPVLLYVAVGLQVVIVLGAGYEFVRRIRQN